MSGSGKFYIMIENEFKWYMRGTSWASFKDRATIYPSREAAETALKNAYKFMAPAARKAAQVHEMEA